MKKPEIVFWQNVVSFHQSALFNALSRDFRVCLFPERLLDDRRKGEGWEVPDLAIEQLEIVKSKRDVLQKIENHSDAIHVFSGIKSYLLVDYALRLAVKRRMKVGIMSETLDWRGWKGQLRAMKTKWFRLRYGHGIDFVLAIGSHGCFWFEKNGFPKRKIYDWGYFIHIETDGLKKVGQSGKPVLIFVGRLDENKGLEDFLTLLNPLKDKFDLFKVIGDGTEHSRLKRISESFNGKIKFYGRLSHQNTIREILGSDLLVLPSKGKDGWGTVINEALMTGTPVLASINCGAGILLDGKERGEVFDPSDKKKSRAIIFKWMKKTSQAERTTIQKWSNNISEKRAAEYLKEILDHVYGTRADKPKAPWIENQYK